MVKAEIRIELKHGVADPEGDALTIVWSVNGAVVQTNTVAASSPPVAANLTLARVLPLGTIKWLGAPHGLAISTDDCSDRAFA